MVNGKTGSAFVPESGIQQGDPLSPYTFIICLKYLGRYIPFLANQRKPDFGIRVNKDNSKMRDNGKDNSQYLLQGHKKCRSIY